MDVPVEQRAKRLAHYPWPARAAIVLDRAAAFIPRAEGDVLITGFWRSGTTWLQEVLADALMAKTVFEPMSPAGAGRAVGAPWIPSSAQALQHSWMPLNYSALNARDRRYLDWAFRGCASSAFTLHCRMSVAESLRPRSVIKCVRAGFLLSELLERHRLYGLHIRRDPGAVIASFLQCRWSWSFKDVRFETLFSRQDPEPALRQDVERLKAYDDKSEAEKIAAYWAFAEKRIADFRHPRFTIVGYEPLVAAGKEGFTDLLAWLSGPVSAEFEVERGSTVTIAERLNISASERAHSWRARLDGATVKRIDAAILDIWPEAPVQGGALVHGAVARPVAAEKAGAFAA